MHSCMTVLSGIMVIHVIWPPSYHVDPQILRPDAPHAQVYIMSIAYSCQVYTVLSYCSEYLITSSLKVVSDSLTIMESKWPYQMWGRTAVPVCCLCSSVSQRLRSYFLSHPLTVDSSVHLEVHNALPSYVTMALICHWIMMMMMDNLYWLMRTRTSQWNSFLLKFSKVK